MHESTITAVARIHKKLGHYHITNSTCYAAGIDFGACSPCSIYHSKKIWTNEEDDIILTLLNIALLVMYNAKNCSNSVCMHTRIRTYYSALTHLMFCSEDHIIPI